MAPLPNTRVIPRGWEAHHAPVSEGGMTATVRFTRGLAGVLSESERRTIYPTPAEVWAGLCRVTPASRSFGRNEPVVGDQAKPLEMFVVEVPLAAPQILVADFGEILTAPDAGFIGRRLEVVSYPGGSLVWDRNLLCQEVQPQGR